MQTRAHLQRRLANWLACEDMQIDYRLLKNTYTGALDDL
jgi:hypothetical protein